MSRNESMTEIAVTVNGEVRSAPSGLTLVAVERNLEIAPRSAYDTITIEPDDRLEIVHFVGGG